MSAHLEDNDAVSIGNLGTLSPYIYHGHKAHNINTRELYNLPPRILVRFHPSETMRGLLAERKNNFFIKKTLDDKDSD